MATKLFSLEGKVLKLDSAEDLYKHVQPLKDSGDVEEVRFQGNTLGVEACKALAAILETKQSLRIANLADIFTGRLLSEIPTAIDALLKALLKCPNLHTINLNDNAFGLNTVEPLRPFLSQHAPLQHLYLNNNGLGPQAGMYVAEALTALAEKKEKAGAPPLETVICGRNRLETGSMAAWSKAYEANKHVKVIRMVQNGIRQEGIALLLSAGLAHCSQLEVLDLQDNTFTALASKTLSAVLPKLGAIKELAVGDCLLSARGGRYLGVALAKGTNAKLEVLRLQYNEIDEKGLKAITEAVESESSLPRLRRVELNGNKFNEDDECIERLQTALGKHKSLYTDLDEDDEELWGVDELDELEEPDSDDEDEDDTALSEAEEEGEKIIKSDEAAEDEPVAQKKDADVDELAQALGKTELK
ncbi:RNI-like protein [Polychaeton citri CBS 116435]|uniref:RNI-like protein n=1 Tax=Polychaeton citri CBS 116435 TaxID=1314669 RepID=A0A9P4UT69_9PEZI|nr:RNI-like protein [Polychaeton citri CBS 116435]